MNKKLLFLLLITMMILVKISAQNITPKVDTSQVKVVNLNEVVVKSAKSRNVIIKELPASISLVNSSTIEKNEITSLKNLSGYVPNLFMPDYGSRLTSPVYIRGIGSRINAPSIGLYVDNVPYFEKAAFDFDFADIDRIEVLRGPQGTLYGRNTMGGLINVYTKNPSDVKETKLELAGGNFDYLRTDISHSGPLSDKTGIAVNAFYGRQGGFFVNDFNHTPVDKQDYYGSRIKLVHNASDNLKFQVTSNYEHTLQGGYPYARINTTTGEVSPINYDHYSTYKRDLLSSAFVAEYKLGNLVIKSATSHQYLKDIQDVDQDFTPFSYVYVIQSTDQNMISQELTIRNSAKGKYSWIIGAFGFWQHSISEVDLEYGKDAGKLKMPALTSSIKDFNDKTKGAAVFHESTLKDILIKGLAFTAGVRADFEESTQGYNNASIVKEVTTQLDNSDASRKFSKVLPKASVTYAVTNSINTFATFATGYKTGGFNTSFTGASDPNRSFKPELSTNYEAGIKSTFFNKGLLVNMSAFYIDMLNQQITQLAPSGQGVQTTNAGKSYSKGLETEVVIRPARNLGTYFSYGFTEARFVDYQRDSKTNYSGNYIPMAPGNIFMAGVDFSLPMNNKRLEKIVFSSNYSAQGKIYWNEDNKVVQKFYGLLNAKISFVNKLVQVDFWGKNMLNEKYNSYYLSSLGSTFVQLGKPMQWGINLIAKF
jgi:iron complex outermembrane recepter protein